MVLNLHSGLSRDLSLILNDADDFNVIFQVGENQNSREFRAHSVILRARSPYFKSALSSEWVTKKDGMIMFNKPNIAPNVFDMILKYIYAGELDLINHPGEHILGLLVASDELLLEELFIHIQDHLINEQTTWVQQNFVLVLHTVFKLASCKQLQDYCLESICADAQPFITSKDFPLLDKDILYGLLKRDDLYIEEIVAWDNLIKWGIQQTPGLGNMNSDRTKWNDKDYEALKDSLNQFIPLIRFVEISPIDYFDKVRPYKAVLPNHIYEEIEEFYFKGTSPKTTILPPRTGMIQRIDSRIIKPKLINIIINWINRKDSNATLNKKDSSNVFNLIYRKSRDGSSIIRNKCIGQGAILVLIKIKYSDKIYGGYNPVGWVTHQINHRGPRRRVGGMAGQYLSTTESFIFSFENDEDNKNMKISRVINPSCSIYDDPRTNGINFGGSDLNLQDDRLYISHSGYYENNLDLDLVGYGYEVEEIEAFSAVIPTPTLPTPTLPRFFGL